jgi:N-acyl-D-aspartate/D-glutamate deacylase
MEGAMDRAPVEAGALDLKIVGGTIVDGTRARRFRGDVGVKDGRIVAVGEVPQPAHQTIDATGLVVAPGFVDVHTHYDAQVFWEPTLSPSCFHGVTTVIGGFCGFSIAPLSPEATDYLMRLLSRVEGMPLVTLETSVPWTWRSFGEFLAGFEGRIGLNAGFFAGHSAIRRVVMGERAVGHKCTPGELERMKALLDQSLAEGALGFSSDVSPAHNDGDGNPVPSRWADFSEIIELARVVSRHEGTGLELLPEPGFAPEIQDLLTEFSIAGQRAVNWNALLLTDQPDSPDLVARQLAVSDYARARGGEVLALTIPVTPDAYLNFMNGMGLDMNPGSWRDVFKLPPDARMRALRDPELRRRLAADAANAPQGSVIAVFAEIEGYLVVSVQAERNKAFVGRQIGEIAQAEGRAPIDVMLDIALDDDLLAIFSPPLGGNGPETFQQRGDLWRDDRTLIGASDAGAHMDMIDTFSFATSVLQKGVREYGVISLEEAVHQLTDRPARYVGLIDRGRLAVGHHADVVVFDEASVGPAPTYPRYDVPGEQFRLYAEANGVAHVIVNGVEIVRRGEHTGKLPGKVLRSGQDTRTVPIGAMRDAPAASVEVV